MEMDLRTWINHKPRLSPTVYNSLQGFVKLKVDMHNIYIRAQKDPTKKWTKMPFVATNDALFNVLETWPPEWHVPNFTEIEKSTAQKKKEETKVCVT